MHANPLTQPPRDAPAATALVGLYTRTLLWYVLLVAVLWLVGVESIYGNPTPFYGLLSPVFGEAGILPHLRVLLVTGAFLTLWAVAMRRLRWLEREPSRREAAWTLAGVYAFAVLFALSVAMMRGGVDGITHAYERAAYEFIGDIGRGGGIRGLFAQYNAMHAYLSMHAKVHPPGPIVILWLLSMVTLSREPFALSIATVLFGSLGLAPLYLWARDLLASRRTALLACMLYAAVPTMVLFTATSANITFTPITLTTLFLFWRALHRGSVPYAAAAGVFYALMSLTSFSLIGVGAFFGLAGLWRMARPAWRWRVVKTAAVMLAAFLALHGAVYLWSGFDMVESFHLAKAQFDADQAALDEQTPRYPAWAFRLLNPLCWFYYAGIPVSVLFVWRLLRRDPERHGLFVVFLLTLAALNFLYLARGEGERSAMYIIPFLAIPAAHLLDEFAAARGRLAPIGATLAFLAAQCWLTESVLYTYW